MWKKLTSYAFAAAAVAVWPAAAQHQSHDQHTKLMKGASVAIEGCVVQALEDTDELVLVSVREIPGTPLDTGLRRVYWLNDIDGLKGNVNKRVRVDGRIDEVERHEMEIKTGKAAGGGTIVEIEGPGRQIKTTPANAEVTGTSGITSRELDIPTTVIRLNVDKVTVTAATCAK